MTRFHINQSIHLTSTFFNTPFILQLEAEKLKEVVEKERQPEPVTVKQARETSQSLTMRVLEFVNTGDSCCIF